MAEKTNLGANSTSENFEWEDGVIVAAFDKSVAKKFENMKKMEKQWQNQKKDQEKVQEEMKREEMEVAEQERRSEERKRMEEELAEIPMADVPEKKYEWQPVPPKPKENKASTSSPKRTPKNDEDGKSLSPKPDENKKHKIKKQISFKLDENKKDEAEKSVDPKLDENKWKVGAHCRAIYSVDGNEYEATIMKVDYKKGTCVVKFCGYEYEEEVRLDTLLPTGGRSNWQNQRHEANKDTLPAYLKSKYGLGPAGRYYLHLVPPADAEEVYHWKQFNDRVTREQESRFRSGWQVPEFRNQRGGSHRDCKCNSQLNSVNRGLPPPPPPFVLSNLPVDEGDALSAMLMSWYMSGFHTGYYQGLLKSRNNNHHLH